MKILITGASGLLGTELVRQVIDKGWSVGGVDLTPQGESLSRCKVVVIDLRDPAACGEICTGYDAVVHTAAVQHHDNPPKFGRERFFGQNAEMTRHCVDAAAEQGVRHFVCISSDMVYGIPRHGPFRETDTPVPIGPYGRSKLESERLCEAKRSGGMTVTILRPRLIVGPGRLGILTKLFDRIRAGKSVPLIGDAPCDKWRSFIHGSGSSRWRCLYEFWHRSGLHTGWRDRWHNLFVASVRQHRRPIKTWCRFRKHKSIGTKRRRQRRHRDDESAVKVRDFW